MMWEVVLRYVFEGRLCGRMNYLWMAGLFILSGFYAMQQRSHIRIFYYDMLPVIFKEPVTAFRHFNYAVRVFLVYGGYGEAKAKFLRGKLLERYLIRQYRQL